MNKYTKELQILQVAVKEEKEHELDPEIKAELEKLFKEECYVCEKTRAELEVDNGLTRTLVTDNGFLSFCDDHYLEDGSFDCANCGYVFKEFKPDLRKPKNKLLWIIYGSKTTVNLAKGSNIYCTNCVER